MAAPVVPAMWELADVDRKSRYRRIEGFIEHHGHVMSADWAHRAWHQQAP